MHKSIFALTLLALSVNTLANGNIKYICSKTGVEDRVIEVVYAQADTDLPCDATYTKDGTTKNLWHYDNTKGACEARAAEFADKQRGWGMECKSNTETESSAPATPDNLKAD